MIFRYRLPFIALVLAAPVPLTAQSAQDFQLPPNPTPSPTPRAQGPVDTESGNLPVAPRVVGPPTPTPRPPANVQPVPAPTPTPAPIRTPAPSTRTETRPQSVQTPRTQPNALPSTTERLPLDPGETAPIVPGPIPSDERTRTRPVPSPAVTAPEVPEGGDADGSGWIWPAVGGGLLALLGLGYAFSQRRRSGPPPEIERPVVRSGGPISPADLQIRTEAIKLTRSVMNATLHYRVSLINKATHALSNVAVGADIVSAHGGVPVEQQVASASQSLERRHMFERIAPGQSVRYEGQLTIPLSQVRAIRQSNTALFVPLLRLRVDGASEEPLVKTFVVGLGVPDGGRVMPFRLDQGPRSYEPIAVRALD